MNAKQSITYVGSVGLLLQLHVAAAHAEALGDHMPGISDADFTAATSAFTTVETAADGLGPIFNGNSCGGCHDLGAVGGAGAQIERRFGRFDNNNTSFNPLANEGGSLRQLFSLGAWSPTCNVPTENVPPDATIVGLPADNGAGVGRLTTPLFGLGLVDAMPDKFFQDLAKTQPAAVRGTVNVVNVLLPDPADPSQSIGASRVGRFGWKAGVPNLVQFAADAYLNEMGITTQHCSRGVSINNFATESAPNGIPVAPSCEDGKPGVDDSVGTCNGGLTEVQEDVAEFNRFMTFLAPPPRAPGADNSNADLDSDDDHAPAGRHLFDKAGCADCHVRKAFKTPNKPPTGVPGNRKFFPFSDFLLHDMGALGDQIGNAGDSPASTRMMRTAPLWGIHLRPNLLHDGRASDIPSAVAAHDGQGRAAADAFGNLTPQERNQLVEFVQSL